MSGHRQAINIVVVIILVKGYPPDKKILETCTCNDRMIRCYIGECVGI